MDEEEIRRRDIERQEKKRRKQEERLRKMEEKRRSVGGMHYSADGSGGGSGDMMRLMMDEDARSASSKSLRLSIDNFLSPTSSMSGTEASCSSFSDHISALSEKGCASAEDRIIFGALSSKSAISPGGGSGGNLLPRSTGSGQENHGLHHLDSSLLPTPPRAHENPSNTNNAKSSPFSIDRLLESPKVPRGRRPNCKYPMVQACKSLGASLSLGLLPFFPITQPMGFLVPQIVAGPDSPLSAATFGKTLAKTAPGAHHGGQKLESRLQELCDNSKKPANFLDADIKAPASPVGINEKRMSATDSLSIITEPLSPSRDWPERCLTERPCHHEADNTAVSEDENDTEDDRLKEQRLPVTVTDTNQVTGCYPKGDDLSQNDSPKGNSPFEKRIPTAGGDEDENQGQNINTKNTALNLSIFSDRNNNKNEVTESEGRLDARPLGQTTGSVVPATNNEDDSDHENIEVDEVDVDEDVVNN